MILIVIFVTISCTKEELGGDIRVFINLPEQYVEQAHALIDYGIEGTSYEIGTLREIKANDGPGLRFLGWRKGPGYCDYQPLVDPDDPRVAFIFKGDNYMGNCNAGNYHDVKITAEYIRVFD